jgi:hypothetical protein
MSDSDDDAYVKPDGHRYEAPESDEVRHSKEWVYAVLGILFLVLVVLGATGKVPLFG